MVTEVSIDAVKPAAYNPRKITKEQQQELCKSIRRFGLIVPILVNRKDNVIIAGHQRTKAARLVGIQKVPVQYVESINLGDEIKFNQIHNATESGTVMVRFDGMAEHGKFIELDNKDFTTIKNTATLVQTEWRDGENRWGGAPANRREIQQPSGQALQDEILLHVQELAVRQLLRDAYEERYREWLSNHSTNRPARF